MKKFLLIALLVTTPVYGQDLGLARSTIERVSLKHNYRTPEGAQNMTSEVVSILVCADPNWGRKSTNGGPTSGDTIAYRRGPMTPDGRNTPMSVWDFCGSCGDPGASISFWAAQYPLIVDQRFIQVPCAGGPVDPGPVDPPNPPGPVDPEMKLLMLQLIAKVEELKQGQDQQTEALKIAISELRAEIAKGIKIRW